MPMSDGIINVESAATNRRRSEHTEATLICESSTSRPVFGVE